MDKINSKKLTFNKLYNNTNAFPTYVNFNQKGDPDLTPELNLIFEISQNAKSEKVNDKPLIFFREIIQLGKYSELRSLTLAEFFNKAHKLSDILLNFTNVYKLDDEELTQGRTVSIVSGANIDTLITFMACYLKRII